MSQYSGPYAPREGGQAGEPSTTDVARNEASDVGRWLVDAGSQVAQTATDQAKEVVENNLSAYKDGMVSTVKSDPTALEATLNTIAPTIRAAVAGHPVEEERGPAGDALIQHLQGEVIGSAVQSWANQHEGIARSTLDKYKDLIDPETVGHLSTYIDNMAGMRQADYEASRRDQLKQIYNNSDQQALQHLTELGHPETGEVQFPPSWGQRMMANPGMLPETKASMLKAYAGLQVNGDPVSDPNVVSGLIRQAASPEPGPSVGDVIGHVGQRLSVQDAAWIGSRIGPQPPQVKAEMQAVADTMQNARAQIGNAAAYGRFVNWFLPTYQRTAAQGVPYQDSLSPQSKGFIAGPERMAQFQPTGDDMIRPAVRTGARLSLGQIFGG